jgi:subtilisin family serine protease
MFRAHRLSLALVLAAAALCTLGATSASGYAVDTQRYIITLDGDYAVTEGYAVGTDYAVYAVTHQYAVYAVQAAGGQVVNDLSTQIGVIVAESANANFATLVEQYAVVNGYAVIESVSKDKAAKGRQPHGNPKRGSGLRTNPDLQDDPDEGLQWDMAMMRTDLAHDRHAGWRSVDVGVLDSGVDASHVDFTDAGIMGGSSNVDCARGRVSVPESPTLTGLAPNPCEDTSFHGTHVAGSIAAQSNGIGIVGVAPDVTLVPITVCQVYACWWSSVVDGITYAGDIELDVINMSFYADDQQLTECNPNDSATVTAIERALAYARSRGVVPVAALGNSGLDLAAGEYANCKVVPSESPGVIGVTSLGADGKKASYSNYGYGSADVAAPGGNGSTGGDSDASDGVAAVHSTFPHDQYLTANGTSMASPHAAGVAALIVSRYGSLASDGDVELRPDLVQWILQRRAVDIGTPGYDAMFGNGRVDALRAIT